MSQTSNEHDEAKPGPSCTSADISPLRSEATTASPTGDSSDFLSLPALSNEDTPSFAAEPLIVSSHFLLRPRDCLDVCQGKKRQAHSISNSEAYPASSSQFERRLPSVEPRSPSSQNHVLQPSCMRPPMSQTPSRKFNGSSLQRSNQEPFSPATNTALTFQSLSLKSPHCSSSQQSVKSCAARLSSGGNSIGGAFSRYVAPSSIAGDAPPTSRVRSNSEGTDLSFSSRLSATSPKLARLTVLAHTDATDSIIQKNGIRPPRPCPSIASSAGLGLPFKARESMFVHSICSSTRSPDENTHDGNGFTLASTPKAPLQSVQCCPLSATTVSTIHDSDFPVFPTPSRRRRFNSIGSPGSRNSGRTFTTPTAKRSPIPRINLTPRSTFNLTFPLGPQQMPMEKSTVYVGTPSRARPAAPVVTEQSRRRLEDGNNSYSHNSLELSVDSSRRANPQALSLFGPKTQYAGAAIATEDLDSACANVDCYRTSTGQDGPLSGMILQTGAFDDAMSANVDSDCLSDDEDLEDIFLLTTPAVIAEETKKRQVKQRRLFGNRRASMTSMASSRRASMTSVGSSLNSHLHGADVFSLANMKREEIEGLKLTSDCKDEFFPCAQSQDEEVDENYRLGTSTSFNENLASRDLVTPPIMSQAKTPPPMHQTLVEIP